jgi:hypothetical protein
MENSWRIKTDAVDPLHLGRMAIRLWSGEIKKHLQLRAAFGSRINILDVQYRPIKDNAIAVIRDVYRHAGRDLTPLREQAMLAWEARNPQHQRGGYSYKMEDYGLTRDMIDAAFIEYNRRFPK